MTRSMIEAKGLTKRFKDILAVDNVDFEVKEGEIFGLLGPNGAGKSTMIRMLTTLSNPTSGTAKVNGFDIGSQKMEVRASVGLVAEKLIMYDLLTARENLMTFCNLYHIDRKTAKARIEKLLKLVEMEKWADKKIGTYSTGMKQRINVIRALVSDPPLIFMDEPTLGLDPQTTKNIREFIQKLNGEGKTIVLTTHIMHEAEVLCHRIGIIDHGKIVALDSPARLKDKVRDSAKHMVEVRVLNADEAMLVKIRASGSVMAADLKEEHLVKIIPKGEDPIPGIVDTIRSAGGKMTAMNTHEPTLEDVFLFLTGSEMRDQAQKKEKTSFGHGPRFRAASRVR